MKKFGYCPASPRADVVIRPYKHLHLIRPLRGHLPLKGKAFRYCPERKAWGSMGSSFRVTEKCRWSPRADSKRAVLPTAPIF